MTVVESANILKDFNTNTQIQVITYFYLIVIILIIGVRGF